MLTAVAGGTWEPPPRVLVCDDEPYIVRLIQANFEQFGCKVFTTYNGIEGLNVARREKPDLVVLDSMMPFMDGLEVIRALRSDPELKETPIVLLSAKAQDKDVFEAYHNGADIYLTKPFNPLELTSILRGLGRR